MSLKYPVKILTKLNEIREAKEKERLEQVKLLQSKIEKKLIFTYEECFGTAIDNNRDLDIIKFNVNSGMIKLDKKYYFELFTKKHKISIDIGGQTFDISINDPDDEESFNVIYIYYDISNGRFEMNFKMGADITKMI